MAVSPLAPTSFPELPPVAGVRFSAAEAGVRYVGRLDVMLADVAPGASLAGLFTRSATRSAPVLWCQARLAELYGEEQGFALQAGEGGGAVAEISLPLHTREELRTGEAPAEPEGALHEA